MAKVFIQSRDARHHYEILETVEAGIELFGYEVKAIKSGSGSLKGAFIAADPKGLSLVKMYIPPYQVKNAPPAYDPYRNRRLLLQKKEIKKFADKKKSEGLTLIPLSLYDKKNLIKVEIALVRGKKQHDKRQSIKKREADREIRRTLKTIR